MRREERKIDRKEPGNAKEERTSSAAAGAARTQAVPAQAGPNEALRGRGTD